MATTTLTPTVAENITGAGVDWVGPDAALADDDTGASITLTEGQSSDWLSLSSFTGDSISGLVDSVNLISQLRSGASGNVDWEIQALIDGSQVASNTGTASIGEVYSNYNLDIVGTGNLTATQLNDPLLEIRLRLIYAGQGGPFLVDVINVSIDYEEAIMSAESSIKLQIDRLAKGRQTWQSAFATGDDFWTKVDAAADEVYENMVKGQDITDLDTTLSLGKFGGQADIARWLTLHQNYFAQSTTAASPGLGLSTDSWNAYLELVGWRVPYEFAELYKDKYGVYLDAQHVFPKGTRVASEADPATAGMHQLGSWATSVYTSVDGAVPTTMKGAPILCVTRVATPGGTGHAVTATLQDALTTKTVTFTPNAASFGHVVIGQAAIGSGGSAAGQKAVLIKTAVTQFAAGEWVLITKADLSAAEVCQIDEINTLTLTMESNLVNTWLEDDLVLPMYTNVTRQAGTLSADRYLDFYALPDRIIAL